MLILTRKVDQAVVIAGNIIVKVLSVERDRVKIGISAPGEVTVIRSELVENGVSRYQKKTTEGNESNDPPIISSA